MQFNYNETYEAVENFRNQIKDAVSLGNQIDATIKEADKALCDIRHVVELEIEENNAASLCNLIKKWSLIRRNAKDAEEVLLPFIEFAKKNSNIIKDIGTVANSMKKIKEKIESPRSYNVRILTEEFGKVIPKEEEID